MTKRGLSKYRGSSAEVIYNISDWDYDLGDTKTWQEERGEERCQQHEKMSKQEMIVERQTKTFWLVLFTSCWVWLKWVLWRVNSRARVYLSHNCIFELLEMTKASASAWLFEKQHHQKIINLTELVPESFELLGVEARKIHLHDATCLYSFQNSWITKNECSHKGTCPISHTSLQWLCNFLDSIQGGIKSLQSKTSVRGDMERERDREREKRYLSEITDNELPLFHSSASLHSVIHWR